MEDRELDNLLATWAEEEIEVPFEVHEKTMQRIRSEARRQKLKRWGSLAGVAAVCCLCVPLAVTQMGGEKQTAVSEETMLTLARAGAGEEKSVANDMVFNVNSAYKTEALEEVQLEEDLNEEYWIECLTKLESESKILEEQRASYREAPTPKALGEINAETERLLKLVAEYEQVLDPEYTALTLRLNAVKELLQEAAL